MTGTKVLRILKAKGLASEIPEDLYHMIKKAVSIRKHLERNRKVPIIDGRVANSELTTAYLHVSDLDSAVIP